MGRIFDFEDKKSRDMMPRDEWLRLQFSLFGQLRRFMKDVRGRRVFVDVTDDLDPARVFLAEDFFLAAQEVVIFEDDIRLDELRCRAEILDAVHDEREGDLFQGIHHDNSSRVVDERTPFAFAFPYEVVRIDADDQDVAITTAPDEVENVQEMDQVVGSGREADGFAAFTGALEIRLHDLNCRRIVEVENHGIPPFSSWTYDPDPIY